MSYAIMLLPFALFVSFLILISLFLLQEGIRTFRAGFKIPYIWPLVLIYFILYYVDSLQNFHSKPGPVESWLFIGLPLLLVPSSLIVFIIGYIYSRSKNKKSDNNTNL